MKNVLKNINIPLEGNPEKGWKAHPVFSGATNNLPRFSCHISVLNQDKIPHPPHMHMEEEILLVLHGEVELILPKLDKEKNLVLRTGQFIYYPANYPHTIKTVSNDPANYLMLKWQSGLKNKENLTHCVFDGNENVFEGVLLEGMSTQLLFEGKTRYLHKLHCHLTKLKPNAGYDPHVDDHDVVILVTEGSVKVEDKIIEKNGVIIHPGGVEHGIINSGDGDAKYIVFEFHGTTKHQMYFAYRFIKKLGKFLISPKRWIRRIKNLVR